MSNVSPRAYAPGRLRALTNQDLRFDLLGVYAGVSTLALHYRNQRGGLVVEVLTFENGLVTRRARDAPAERGLTRACQAL